LTTVVISQSNYIPWKGYFDLIGLADVMILYDDVQFTKRDWRNRNVIKTQSGSHWLTIPVISRGRYHQSILDTVVADLRWPAQHWRAIASAYAHAPAFPLYARRLERLYRAVNGSHLSAINHGFLVELCAMLGIVTDIRWSHELVPSPDEDRTQRLIDLVKSVGGTRYLSGPAAQSYIDPALFTGAGIALTYMDYSDYPEYVQLHGPFSHTVSVIDLLLNAGEEASRYMKFPQGGENVVPGW